MTDEPSALREDPLNDDLATEWLDPRTLVRTHAAIAAVGWPTFVSSCAVMGLVPVWLAAAVVCTALLAAWDLNRRGALHASRCILLTVSFSLAPVMLLIALIAGAAVYPASWFHAGLIAFGTSVLTAVAYSLRLILGGRLPPMAQLVPGRNALRVGRRRLPGLTWIIAIAVVAMAVAAVLGEFAFVRLAAGFGLLALLAQIAFGPAAEWLATAWLVRAVSKRAGKTVRLA